MIRNDPVGHTAFDHVRRDIALIGVTETGDNAVISVEFRYRVKLSLIQKSLHQRAVNFISHRKDTVLNALFYVTIPPLAHYGG